MTDDTTPTALVEARLRADAARKAWLDAQAALDAAEVEAATRRSVLPSGPSPMGRVESATAITPRPLGR
jgi:hypothetical protein